MAPRTPTSWPRGSWTSIRPSETDDMPQVRVIAAAIAVPLFAQADEPKPFHFAHDISPLLVKQACASAASPLQC